MTKLKIERDTILPSDTISDFLNWLEEMKALYDTCSEEVNYEDRKVQDFLHELEFAKDKNERNRIATKFSNSRKQRRESKNQALLVKYIVEFLDVKENRECLNRMKKLLGNQRKQEQYVLSEKHYNKRVNIDCTTPVISDTSKFKIDN